MKAMILAAGKGKRMRPVTLTKPKPLVEVAGKALIEHHVERLVKAGIREIVINVSYLGEMIQQHLGDGERWGISILYSHEDQALETGGAILQAAELLGDAPFVLINGDIWVDYPLQTLLHRASHNSGGHLVLVENPLHNEAGDFALLEPSLGDNGFPLISSVGGECYTFSGLSIMSVGLVKQYRSEECDSRDKFPLKEVFKWAIASGRLTGELYSGYWIDVGTPERLSMLNERLVCSSGI